jgi:proteic killer suppression protein
MIGSFQHTGLERLWTHDSVAGVMAAHRARLVRLLDALNAATRPEDMRIPGFDFHPLKGNRDGTFSVSVNGNWRLTFRWEGADALDINYEDYH